MSPKASVRSKGDIIIEIIGENFGADEDHYRPVGVMIGSKRLGPFPCVHTRTILPTKLECRVTAGVGKDLDVTV